MLWPLTLEWYGDRLDDNYVGKSVEHLQRLLTTAGLTGDFWDLHQDISA